LTIKKKAYVLVLDYIIVDGKSRGNAGEDLSKIWRRI
jgi:hypothetical protein